MTTEPPVRELRASDADREATAERLRVAAMEGRLDADELEERLTAAYAARLCSELSPLTADVTPPAPPAAPRPPFAPPRPPFAVPRRRTNGFAIASIIASLLWAWWAGSVVAVACGLIALHQIARSGGAQRGRVLAIAGLVIGALQLLALAGLGVAPGS